MIQVGSIWHPTNQVAAARARKGPEKGQKRARKGPEKGQIRARKGPEKQTQKGRNIEKHSP